MKPTTIMDALYDLKLKLSNSNDNLYGIILPPAPIPSSLFLSLSPRLLICIAKFCYSVDLFRPSHFLLFLTPVGAIASLLFLP